MDYAIVLTISLKFTAGMFGSALADSDRAVEGKLVTQLVDSLNSRMLLMKDVAGYKAEHHAPVEDLVREEKVLIQSKCEAQNVKLDPSSVTEFVQTQMDVGKAIQYRFMADWLSNPEIAWRPPRDLENVRRNITDLDHTILELISEKVRQGDGFGAELEMALIERLSAPNIKPADKINLVNSLKSVRLLSSDVKVDASYYAMCQHAR